MLETVASRDAESNASFTKDEFLQAFRFMLLARILDDKFASLYRAGKIHGGVFLGRGQEAVSVSIGQSLQKGDVFAPLIRDGAGRLAFGETVLDAVRTYLGSSLGPMRGRDGNVHRGKPKEGYLPMISHLGAMIPVVNGMLMSRRFKGIKNVVGAACIGEGATSTGAFHEALNQAAVEKLPLILIVADNQFAYSTPKAKQFACGSLVDRAAGYGIEGHEMDGTDLCECLEVVGTAVRKARAGQGPQLVIAKLLRLCGHGEHDDANYIDTSLKQSALGRDCLKVAEDFLCKQKWANSSAVEQWRKEFHSEVDDAVSLAQREPAPDPYKENWQAISSSNLLEVHSGIA